MGMFDTVKIFHPLPWPEVQDNEWQTQDTKSQCLDRYEIRATGELWHEAYDGRIVDDPDAPLGFRVHQDNKRWERVEVSGQVECHTFIEHVGRLGGMYYSVRFWFRGGVVCDAIYEQRDTREDSVAERP